MSARAACADSNGGSEGGWARDSAVRTDTKPCGEGGREAGRLAGDSGSGTGRESERERERAGAPLCESRSLLAELPGTGLAGRQAGINRCREAGAERWVDFFEGNLWGEDLREDLRAGLTEGRLEEHF